MNELTPDQETYLVIGAAMAVHSELGPGFLESVYAMALSRELISRSIPHQREVAFPVFFKGERLDVRFRVDLVCFQELVVELKAQPVLGNTDVAQVLNYLKAGKLTKALLINFGAPRLQFRRLVL